MSTQTQVPVTPDALLQIAFGFAPARTLLTAVELGLFTELANGPRTLATIRERFGLHARAAADFLDTLVSLNVLDRDDATGRYSNAPHTDLYLDRNKPGYIGGMLEMAAKRLYPIWNNLEQGLRTGRPQNEAAAGGDPFDAIYGDAHRVELFAKSMTGLSLGNARAIAEKFPWPNYKTAADVGCAQGCVPVTLARAHPHLRTTGADLPALKPIFEEYARAHEVADRCTFAACDFFKQELPKADVIIFGHILHDWDLPTKQMLLAKAYRAVPAGGAVIVYDAMIDDARRTNTFGLIMSLNMLLETPGGFDYTVGDGQRWVREAGFTTVTAQPLAGPHTMVVGIK